MQKQQLWLALAAMCLLGASVRAQDGAARKLLQMDFGGLLGGGKPESAAVLATFHKNGEIVQ